MAGGVGPRRRVLAEINVTPLVDVMLVLLVIFMITAPMLEHSLDVQLPEVAAAPLPDKRERLVLRVDRRGRIFVDGVRVPERGWERRLAAIVGNRKEEPIFLEADGRVAYARVAEVLGVLQGVGARKLHLVTEAPKR